MNPDPQPSETELEQILAKLFEKAIDAEQGYKWDSESNVPKPLDRYQERKAETMGEAHAAISKYVLEIIGEDEDEVEALRVSRTWAEMRVHQNNLRAEQRKRLNGDQT